MQRRSICQIVLGIALASAIAACGPANAPFNSIDITGADYAKDFRLTDSLGQPRSLQEFRGKLVVVFFGYTQCPDVCPTTLATMAEVMKQLGDAAQRVQVIFVTVDPARDTPAVLKDHVAHFSPRIVGLTGSEAEIAAMAKAWRAYYRVQGDPRTNPGYLVDHSAFVYVMDAQGRFVGTFGPDASLDAALRLVRRAL